MAGKAGWEPLALKSFFLLVDQLVMSDLMNKVDVVVPSGDKSGKKRSGFKASCFPFHFNAIVFNKSIQFARFLFKGGESDAHLPNAFCHCGRLSYGGNFSANL
jgi:hypothetical protein